MLNLSLLVTCLAGCEIQECSCTCFDPAGPKTYADEFEICEIDAVAEGAARAQACDVGEEVWSCECEDTDEACQKDPKRTSAVLIPTPDPGT